MSGQLFLLEDRGTPVVTAALHAGHAMRSEVEALVALTDADRLREEDPFTDVIADIGVSRIVARQSRFEVDLNRSRDESVYLSENQAWGLHVWRDGISPAIAERSRDAHDAFYAAATALLDSTAERHGSFVLLDVHSYNHRRGGEYAPAADPDTNPEVNVGTESLDHRRFGSVARTFVTCLAEEGYDVRENVKFKGGNFVRWVNAAYDGVGCALAIEFKKTFMDEWTGLADERALQRARTAMADASLRIAQLLGGNAP